MPKPRQPKHIPTDTLTGELLAFYDDFTELNACTAFVLRSCAAAMTEESGPDRRSAGGAMYCGQWLIDRAAELEVRLKKIRERDRGRAVREK